MMTRSSPGSAPASGAGEGASPSRTSFYFSDPKRAAKLQREAESWLGTPFREYSKAKGPAGGVDCVGLCEEILHAAGAVERFHFPRAHADYQNHAFGDRLLEWLRGKGTSGSPVRRDPQSARLAQTFAEITLPDDAQTVTPASEFFMPGDLLVLRHLELFHLPIIYDARRHFVNAVPRLGVIRGTIQDVSYRAHLVAVFRAKAFCPLTSDL